MVRTPHRRAPVALATLAATTLMVVGLSSVPAHAATTEHISNGTFTSTTSPWWATSNITMSVSGGRLCAQVPAGTEEIWDASVGYNGIPLVKGDVYTVTFAASATVSTTVKTNLQLAEDPYTATMSRDSALTKTAKTLTYTATSTLDSSAGQLTFQLGGKASAWTFCLDNVSVTSEPGVVDPSGPEQVVNGGFDDGLTAWYSYGTTSTAVTDGQLCSAVPSGLANSWDAGIGQNDISLVEGSTYTLALDASAVPSSSVRVTIQLGEEPYTAYLAQTVALTSQLASLTYAFTASESTSLAQVAFQVGGAAEEYTFCVDNVSLRGGE